MAWHILTELKSKFQIQQRVKRKLQLPTTVYNKYLLHVKSHLFSLSWQRSNVKYKIKTSAEHMWHQQKHSMTGRQTADGQSNPYVAFCFAGTTKIKYNFVKCWQTDGQTGRWTPPIHEQAFLVIRMATL